MGTKQKLYTVTMYLNRCQPLFQVLLCARHRRKPGKVTDMLTGFQLFLLKYKGHCTVVVGALCNQMIDPRFSCTALSKLMVGVGLMCFSWKVFFCSIINKISPKQFLHLQTLLADISNFFYTGGVFSLQTLSSIILITSHLQTCPQKNSISYW